MAFRWRVDDGPLLVAFGSSLPHYRKKTLSELDSLWQIFLDPRMTRYWKAGTSPNSEDPDEKHFIRVCTVCYFKNNIQEKKYII